MQQHEPAGIHTKQNQCFLHSTLQSLCYSLLPLSNFVAPNQFAQYLYDTMKHILDSKQSSQIDLFWNALRSLQSHLFSQEEDQQMPQDSLEALLCLLEQSALGDHFQIKFHDGDYTNFLQVRIQPKTSCVMRCEIGEDKYKQRVKLQSTVKEVLDKISPHCKTFLYVANFNEYKQITDYSLSFQEIMQRYRCKRWNKLFLKTYSSAGDYQFTMWTRFNIQQNDIWKTICHVQPFIIDMNASIQEVYVIFASLLQCKVCDIEIKSNILSYDQNDSSTFIELIDNLQEIFDVNVKNADQYDLSKLNTYKEQTSSIQSNTQIFMDMVKWEIKSYDSEVAQLPKILVIVITRVYQGEDHHLIKSNKLIQYPLVLDLQDYLQQTYKLTSVINHQGGINDGHYYTYVTKNSSWYCVDNQSSYPIDNPVSSKASILFYKEEKKQIQ